MGVSVWVYVYASGSLLQTEHIVDVCRFDGEHYPYHVNANIRYRYVFCMNFTYLFVTG